ncbi:MAG: hypothetical protein LAP87_00880 [Acidobacteriia bacterium]|nr:hypothetical protein [Terriglobia bacterium]
MDRKRKLFLAKAAVVLGAIPLTVWAYEFGPDAGYAGVPGENGTCAAAGCHTGAGVNAGKGGVAVGFRDGLTYTPGVKQHLTVTISDPAATQKRWGFQLTARLASDAKTMAGTFASTDPFTTMLCANAGNIGIFQEAPFSAGKAQTCPANEPIQYIEHSAAGTAFPQRFQPGGLTYEFDWTPPESDAGDIVIYVAGNAANGDTQNTGDNIYTNQYTLTTASRSVSLPAIDAGAVLNGASFQGGIVPNSWLTIKGSNLAPGFDTWTNFIGPHGELPTSLDGVKVTVGGKPAYVNAISPGQINVLAPDVGFGSLEVTVTTPVGTSAALTAVSQPYGPAFFLWPGNQPVATRNQDFSIAAKNGTFGAATVPAKPGDVIVLWGTGFGATNPAAPVGVQVPSDKLYLTASPVTVTINNAPVQVFGAALAAPFAGLYQVNIRIPDDTPDGDWPIVAAINGVSSPATTVITIQR